MPAIAITGAETTNGSWQFSLDDGTTWTDLGTVSDASALLLDATTEDASTQRLRFLPSRNFNGTVSLTFRAWDMSQGSAGTRFDASTQGGLTPFSEASDTATLTVTPVNDPPILFNAGSLVAENLDTPSGLEGDASAVFAPAAAIAGNSERFVIAWTDMPSTNTVEVKAQVRDANGSPITSVITVTPAPLSFSPLRPITLDVGMDASGRFAVIYDTVPDLGGLTDTVLRRYAADGTSQPLVSTNGLTTRHEGTVALDMGPSGEIYIGYNMATSTTPASHRAALARYLNFDGGVSSTVNLSVGGPITPLVAALSGGHLLYAYPTLAATTPTLLLRSILPSGGLTAAATITLTTRVAPRLVPVRDTLTARLLSYEISAGTTNLAVRTATSSGTSTAPTFTAPITLVTGVSLAIRPSGVVTTNGHLIASYGVPTPDGSVEIRIQRFDADGSSLAPPLTLSLSNPSYFELAGGFQPDDTLRAVSVTTTSTLAGANTPTSHHVDLHFGTEGPSVIDSDAPDTFAPVSGTLLGFDVEDSPLSYGLADAASGPWLLGATTYDFARTGTYGALYLRSTDGNYAYVPDDAAINALDADVVDDFSVTASDGDLTTTNGLLRVTIFATNDHPIAPGRTFPRTSGSFKVAISSLLAQTTDAESDPLTLDSFNASTTGGGSVVRVGDWLLYTPAAAGEDTFDYTVGDGRGGSATATITLQAPATSGSGQTRNVLRIQPDGPDMEISFAGIPGVTYTIQVTDSLVGTPVWTDLDSVAAGPNGRFTYRDIAPGGGSRFYRAVVP
jgi:VCBS repeat-containing protein